MRLCLILRARAARAAACSAVGVQIECSLNCLAMLKAETVSELQLWPGLELKASSSPSVLLPVTGAQRRRAQAPPPRLFSERSALVYCKLHKAAVYVQKYYVLQEEGAY